MAEIYEAHNGFTLPVSLITLEDMCVCVQQLHEQAGYSSSAQLCLNCGNNIPLFKRLPNQLIKVFSKQLFGVYPKGSNVI